MIDIGESLLALAPRLREKARRTSTSIMIQCPYHAGGNERTPSCVIPFDKPVFFCLAGETQVLTSEGSREIRDLAGGVHKLLTSTGVWVSAPVRSFGRQTLWEITLQRNGVHKKIRATAEHRWFVHTSSGNSEVETWQLKPGQSLAAVFPQALKVRTKSDRPLHPSAFGIARGIVYGDGTLATRGRGSLALLYGEKDAELMRWFPPDAPKYRTASRTTISGLPTYFKTERPCLEKEPASYLYGWLAGYFAADGSVAKDGHVQIYSAVRENLEYVQALCGKIGVGTYEITEYWRKGYYALALMRSSLPEEFFLLSEHRKRFLAHRTVKERRRWRVVSVDPTKLVEEVYCAVVPRFHAFALAGNILTGNCHGCKISGHVFQLVRTLGATKVHADLILKQSGFQERQAVEEKGIVELSRERRYNVFRGPFVLKEDLLDDFRVAPTSLIRKGFLKSTLRHFEVGFDNTEARITFPLRNIYGDLVGVSGRTIFDDYDPRYKIYKRELVRRGAPADYDIEETKKAILWHSHMIRPVLLHKEETLYITEGFKACMWLWQAGYESSVALVGSYLTRWHAELLSRYVSRVVLFLDNNTAGWTGTAKAGLLLLRRGIRVDVANYPTKTRREQPDDLLPDEIDHSIATAKSYLKWRRSHEAARVVYGTSPDVRPGSSSPGWA